jgi:hypothetical protein
LKHEKNTYKLPQGEPIRREMVRVFREQRKQALEAINPVKSLKADQDMMGGGMSPLVPEVDWDAFLLGPLEMSKRFVPHLSVIWDKAGANLLARVNEDPASWEVEDPNLQKKINDAAMAFCEATNATTTRQLNQALEDTRDALRTGASVETLTQRVMTIFDQAEKWRARRIATSEASRAYHAAELESAIESEVVAGFAWLASEDACPYCLTVARRVPAVRLGQPFAVMGNNPDYSIIQHPPLHPHCQCSLEEILFPEYGGPTDVAWGTTLEQPEPEEQDIEAAENYEPAGRGQGPFGVWEGPAAPVEAPAPAPEPGTPILPGKPIQERLAAYTAGDEKVRQLASITTEADRIKAEYDATSRELSNLLKTQGEEAARYGTPAQKRNKELVEKLDQLLGRQRGASNESRDQVTAILKAKTPHGVTVTKPAKGNHLLNQEVAKGQAFLDSTLRKAGGKPLEVKAYAHNGDYRANANTKTSSVHLAYHTTAETVVHEIGHIIEERLPGINEAVQKFLAYRVGDEKPRRLGKLFKGHGYSLWETGREDQFGQYFSAAGSDGKFNDAAAWYAGKVTKTGSEVLTMGLEALYTDAVGFAKKDPEYCKFILGILDGSLR